MACFPEIEIGKQERADDRPKRRGGLIVARRGVCRRRVVTPPGSTDAYMVVLLWLFCVKNETWPEMYFLSESECFD